MTARKPNPQPSPWRRGPNCETKRARISFVTYQRRGKKIARKPA